MPEDLPTFAGAAAFNFAAALIIVRGIYYPVTQDKRYVFAFLVFNPVIFYVMTMLTSIELSLGVGFGLFAIFTVLRYRTEEIPIREITYLFVMIALPVMNSALASGENLENLLVANITVMLVLFVLEREWGFHFEASKKLTYEVIENIRPENYDLLLEDLRRRTGLPVRRVEIGRIDFLRDSAQLQIFYDEPEDARVRSDLRGDPEPAGSAD
jgi:hypothetical protein